MGQELELKYKLEGHSHYEELLEYFKGRTSDPWKTTEMLTDYYDTPEMELAKRQWTLRIRMENGSGVLTCKTPGTNGARNEWEIPGGSLPTGLMGLVRRGAPEELMELYEVPMRPICGARFTRRSCMVEYPGGKAELALDRGVLRGRSRELPFYEMEIEHKSGDEESFRQWCGMVEQELKLTIEPRSKFSRAVELMGV